MAAKTKRTVDLILNLAIVLSTVLAVGVYFFSGPDALGSTGTGCFKYFTTDSNILAAAASLVYLVFLVRKVLYPEAKIPHAVMTFKYVGTVAVTITLLTVVFFLAPVSCMKGGLGNFFWFFQGNTFALHFSTPVLALISLLFFEGEDGYSFRDSLYTLLPTVVYSVVYLILVVFVRVWTDWYGFTFGGKNALAPVSMAAMYLVTLGVAAALRKLKRSGDEHSKGEKR